MIIVQKFGGSSLADNGGLRRCAERIAAAKNEGLMPVAVLSAQGDTSDILIERAQSLAAEPSRRELDALLSTGELGSVSLMAMLLIDMGCGCVSLSGRQAGIRTDTSYGEARILDIDTERILRELDSGKAVIVAGFQGICENDDITTLGRGGSDTTAVALAAALKAKRCEIYSDVDGIYTADPRIVRDAEKLDFVDPEDMRTLAANGSQVLCLRSVELAMESGVDIVLLSSLEKKEGTLVTHMSERAPLCGITRSEQSSSVSIVGRAADSQLLADAAALLSDRGITVLSTECGENVCRIFVEPEELLSSLELLHEEYFKNSQTGIKHP